jgi:thiamine biosynthesis lipoprotein
MEAEARFRAMGSDVHVLVVRGDLGLLDVARDFIDELERRWSRFQATSEISLLNALAGCTIGVSPHTLALVERALEGARLTGGRYDPTVLGAVVRAGYDRSFELLTEATRRTSSPLALGYEGIAVDAGRGTVTLPPGVGFDPGGIGKGYAADLLVQELLSRGAAGACANVGGDLRAEGEPPNGESWTVAIEDPTRSQPAVLIGLAGGAVATSTRIRRVWGPADDRRHHLIDPATGEPASSGLASATVVAAEAWQAEVLAKAAFIAGLFDGLAILASTGTDGLLIDDGGALHRSAGFDRFTRRSAGANSTPIGVMEGSLR